MEQRAVGRSWELEQLPSAQDQQQQQQPSSGCCSDRTAISLKVWSIVQGTSPDVHSTVDGAPLVHEPERHYAFKHMLGQQRHCHWQDLGGFGHTAHDDLQTSCVLWLNAGDW
jgi:hypothetical protein